jgi:hypothetical protein
LLKTAGRWPWKSESAKECVTTHLPKQLALKMDGAKASHLYPTAEAEQDLRVPEASASRKVAGVARKALGVILAGAAPGADLGGSSKYSREALEDRCGEGFRVNSR